MSPSQSAHDQMVQALVNHLKQNGFSNITADLPGYTRPIKIVWTTTQKGHFADVRADKGAVHYLFEVEDAESIFLDHSAEQFTLFGEYAKLKGAIFVVLVPRAAETTAKQLLRRIGVQAEVWTI